MFAAARRGSTLLARRSLLVARGSCSSSSRSSSWAAAQWPLLAPLQQHDSIWLCRSSSSSSQHYQLVSSRTYASIEAYGWDKPPPPFYRIDDIDYSNNCINLWTSVLCGGTVVLEPSGGGARLDRLRRLAHEQHAEEEAPENEQAQAEKETQEIAQKDQVAS